MPPAFHGPFEGEVQSSGTLRPSDHGRCTPWCSDADAAGNCCSRLGPSSAGNRSLSRLPSSTSNHVELRGRTRSFHCASHSARWKVSSCGHRCSHARHATKATAIGMFGFAEFLILGLDGGGLDQLEELDGCQKFFQTERYGLSCGVRVA